MLGSGLTKDTLFHIWSVIDRSATAATWDAFFEQLAWSFNTSSGKVFGQVLMPRATNIPLDHLRL